MFLPYRTDLEFNRVPFMTIVVCALCTLIFLQQTHSDNDLEKTAQSYCDQDHPRQFWLVMKKLAGNNAERACPVIVSGIYSAPNPDKTIDEVASHAAGWDLMSASESRARTAEILRDALDQFRSLARPSLTTKLQYNPATFNVGHMITAAFAHGSWSHLIGNLIFFYAFATTVEVIIGSLSFSMIVLFLAIGTHTVFYISQHMAHTSVPTVGLSGVVMGFIGLFVYLVPTARIRCLLWIIIFIRIVRVPAWILATWYVGWNVYDLIHDNGSAHINFVAHVSGAFLGYFAGLVFFGERKDWAQAQLRNIH